VGIRHAAGSDPAADLDPDLAQAAMGIGVAAAMRLRDLAPALRPLRDDGAEPELVIEEITLDPEDPVDAITLVACVRAHDAYVASRGRREAASPGALAIARLLAWTARAEMLGTAAGFVTDSRALSAPAATGASGPNSRFPNSRTGAGAGANDDCGGTCCRALAPSSP
jgi:hypothetical protein